MALGATSAIATTDAKVTICHRTDAGSNPYVQQTHWARDVWGGHYNVHPDNTVGVYGVDSDWGDIIPEFTYDGHTYGPLNMTTQGLAIYNNGCNLPDVAVTPLEPTVTGGTCETPIMTVTIPTVEGVIYDPTGVVTVNPGHHVHVSATAAEGYVLQGYTGPWKFENKSDDLDCRSEVSPVAPTVVESACPETGTTPLAPTLTLASTIGVSYHVDPAGPYVAGQTVKVTAEAAEGYKFGALTGGWIAVGSHHDEAKLYVTFAAAPTCLEKVSPVAPTFTQATCEGTSPVDATLTVPVDGNHVTYTASGPAAAGTTVTVTAKADPGYKFVEPAAGGWVFVDASTETYDVLFEAAPDCRGTAELTLPTVTDSVCTLPGEHSDPLVEFTDTATVSYAVDPASGWVAGGSATVTATAAANYKFEATAGWVVSADGKTATHEVTFTDPGACLGTAELTLPTVTDSVCTLPGEHSDPLVEFTDTATVSYAVDPASGWVAGGSATVTATAAANYKFEATAGWVVSADGKTATHEVTFTDPGACLATVLPLPPTAPLATCELQSMTVTLPTTVGVIYTPSGSLVLAPTESVSITATAAQGYQLAGEVTQWQFTNTLDLTTCGGVGGLVVAEIPQATTPTCQTPDMTVTLPVTTGVVYTASGPLLLAPGESVTVTPTADTGFILDASAKPTTFTNSFDTASCAGVAGITVARPVTQPGLGYTGIVWLRDELVLVFALILAGTMLTVMARRRGRAS